MTCDEANPHYLWHQGALMYKTKEVTQEPHASLKPTGKTLKKDKIQISYA